MNTPKFTALLSAFNKTGVVEFAKELITRNWDILASGGTAKSLAAQNVPVVDVARFVGPPILGHRVVTLSREIHAALLATDSEADRAELEKIGVPRIDLVYVDLYPLEEAIESGLSLTDVIEKTDIGGPTMLRSAAKGRRIVICRPVQFDAILKFIDRRSSMTPEDVERAISGFVTRAELRVANYCKASAEYHNRFCEGRCA